MRAGIVAACPPGHAIPITARILQRSRPQSINVRCATASRTAVRYSSTLRYSCQ
ncbi:hypothetical protein C4K25_0668 [Pseudomonas chlororaphis]|nr:hypothetical protein C4K25_0668 [Pseudomonas chlororaphis]